MIAGSPGVGKTRLASELGMEAEREGFITFAAC
jgi:broad-specificity NMP kinase